MPEVAETPNLPEEDLGAGEATKLCRTKRAPGYLADYETDF